MDINSLKSGVFKNEIKNRFLCEVAIDGNDTICYIPSSCRYSNFLNMSGRNVWLEPVADKKARTSYSVFAVEYKHSFILLNMSKANLLFEGQLHRKMFSFLGKRSAVGREVRFDSYRADLFVEDSNTIIEVKSVISLERTAVFPSVYSERMERQLCALRELLDKGFNVCFFILALNPYTKSAFVNTESYSVHKLFCECIDKGMMVKAFSLIAKPIQTSELTLRQIPILVSL